MNTSSDMPVVITTQPGHVLVGAENTIVDCPSCHAHVRTAVKYTATANTYIAAAVCGRLCCCCIPFCSESAKNTDHYCPNCNAYLGTYRK